MKKLFRIKGTESMLGGVAAGLAEYLDIDVTIVRVLFALGFFTPFPVIITYIILWIVMPKQEHYQLSTGTYENEV
ncbi:PspC domain-containing protein [Jiulongibacter sp. NS-SX5]|uniref:PspC domain-containing protein n=1 Tax=Jiulongibacter sp. NS-SX5 TaxID=3463854 RepID=UPI0040594F26